MEQFKAVQAAWTKWGIIITIAGIILNVIYYVFIAGAIATTMQTAPMPQ